jgi:hypothetical protein
MADVLKCDRQGCGQAYPARTKWIKVSVEGEKTARDFCSHACLAGWASSYFTGTQSLAGGLVVGHVAQPSGGGATDTLPMGTAIPWGHAR